ncbi:MAG: hypothetical protein CBE11_02540 [Rickettsiales bacterium TMED251]|nr:MAG: hypothetical protein CBE11_02540 [Rickettsiales bacterium TMED251]|tara:strand:+ start:979 stop:1749 length:771 start_codon:yes stop_codon:yes gene_type:complete
MSIWGKIIGGTTGFALGGPLGAILGLAAGHGMDKANTYTKNSYNENTDDLHKKQKYKEQIFATGVIALAAKLSKADGIVTKNEIEAFKKLFEFPKEDEKSVANLFDAAKLDSNSYQVYASQLYEEFKTDRTLLSEILNSLFAIALADNSLHPKEEKMLLEIVYIFGFSMKDFESIKNIHNKSVLNDKEKIIKYYKVLGVNESDSIEKISAKYKEIVKEYHPDRLQGLGLPKDFLELANNKMMMINEAYNEIKKNRK